LVFHIREEHGLRVCDKSVLKKLFRSKEEVTAGGGNCILRSFVILTCQILFGWSNKGVSDGWAMWHLRGRSLKERDNSEDLGIDGNIILRGKVHPITGPEGPRRGVEV
jgi:hypothetical protein